METEGRNGILTSVLPTSSTIYPQLCWFFFFFLFSTRSQVTMTITLVLLLTLSNLADLTCLSVPLT